MKKIFKRITAYLIDLMILVILVSLISNTSLINKQLDKYNKYYNQLIELSTETNKVITDLEEYYKNEELKDEDYQKLIEDNPNYKENVYKYYEDSKLEKEEYENLIKDIKKDYQNKYIKIKYKIEKNSTISNISYLLIIILYFGVFNLITNGQTLGKKLFRLKIVKKDDTKPNIINYLLRSILLYNVIYLIVSLVCVYTLNSKDYYTITSIIYEIQYYIQWIIIFMITIRKDGRGLHDLIGNTKVIALDKEGNIIEDEPVFNIGINLPEIKEQDKKNSTKVNKKKTKVIDAKIKEKE